MESIYICLTIDVDPDNFDSNIFGPQQDLTWWGLEKGVVDMIEKMSVFTDCFNQHLKYTWFVRCDSELKEVYGMHTYLFEHYADFWMQRKKSKDEIAWHPHEEDISKFEESIVAIKKLSYPFKSVRIGNAFHSNKIMKLLAQNGFKIDSTALPGRIRRDDIRNLDWGTTPDEVYYPSKSDYRVPGKCFHKILEVPMTMIDTQVSYDKTVVKRYLNLSFHHEVIRKSLDQIIRQKNLLIINLHPSELIPQKKKHPLISFDVNEVVINMKYILELVKYYNKEVKFITMADVLPLEHRGVVVPAKYS